MADSIMYREALATAAEARGWSVHWYDRERVFRDAAAALGGEDIDAFLRAMGRRSGRLGRPRTSSQRLRRLQRQCEVEFHPASSASVFHERGNLHELDARAYAVERCHAVQKRIGKKTLAASSESQT